MLPKYEEADLSSSESSLVPDPDLLPHAQAHDYRDYCPSQLEALDSSATQAYSEVVEGGNVLPLFHQPLCRQTSNPSYHKSHLDSHSISSLCCLFSLQHYTHCISMEVVPIEYHIKSLPHLHFLLAPGFRSGKARLRSLPSLCFPLETFWS